MNGSGAQYIVGIDDTDILGARGTNQLARALARALAPRWRCVRILRHQLLVHAGIPYTSHNGSASLLFEATGSGSAAGLHGEVRAGMLADFIPGSDPGLAVATAVTPAVVAWGERCRRVVVTAEEARSVAAAEGVLLEGLGGTEGGVIGALAAIGLAAGGDHGRVLYDAVWPEVWQGAGPKSGHGGGGDAARPAVILDVAALRHHGVDAVIETGTSKPVTDGRVDLGKKLRPNRRAGRTVLFVEAAGPDIAAEWRAVRDD